MNRRNFLNLFSGLTATGFAGCLHPGSAQAAVQGLDPNRLFAALVTGMQDQDLRWNCSARPEQLDNLRYAVTKIEPQTHQEVAFVVSVGVSCQQLSHVVDEYVSRGRGGLISLPDHPLLALENWCVPDTRRLLVFREQMDSLFMELTDRWMHECRQLWHGVRARRISVDEFHEQLCEPHRSRLTVGETKMLYESIHLFLHVGIRPYAWCSTISERAIRLAVTV